MLICMRLQCDSHRKSARPDDFAVLQIAAYEAMGMQAKSVAKAALLMHQEQAEKQAQQSAESLAPVTPGNAVAAAKSTPQVADEIGRSYVNSPQELSYASKLCLCAAGL